MKNKIKISIAVIIMILAAIETRSQTVLPDGGTTDSPWVQDSTVGISWMPNMISSASYSRDVDIILWDANSNSFTTIAEDVNDTLGYYAWEIPSNFTTGTKYKVMIRHADSTHFYMMSADFISIYEAPPTTPLPTSVEDNIQSISKYVVFPNPSSGYVSIKSNKESIDNIEIYSIDGSLVKVFNSIGNIEYSFNISEFQNGSYYAKVNSINGNSEVLPIVINR